MINPAVVDRIEFVTIASTGDATDFGNLTDLRSWNWNGSNATRGILLLLQEVLRSL